jgi:hypothetical protein
MEMYPPKCPIKTEKLEISATHEGQVLICLRKADPQDKFQTKLLIPANEARKLAQLLVTTAEKADALLSMKKVH